MRVRAHPELDRLRIGQGGQLVDRHDAAEPARPGVDEVVLAGDPAPDHGAYAVGADDEVGMLDATVGELEPDRVALVDEVDERQPRCSPWLPNAVPRTRWRSARWMP